MRLESGSTARDRMPMGAIGSSGFYRQSSMPVVPAGATVLSWLESGTISRVRDIERLPVRRVLMSDMQKLLGVVGGFAQ